MYQKLVDQNVDAVHVTKVIRNVLGKEYHNYITMHLDILYTCTYCLEVITCTKNA